MIITKKMNKFIDFKSFSIISLTICAFLSCAPEPKEKPTVAAQKTLIKVPIDSIGQLQSDSTTYNLPLMRGYWTGIGLDRNRTFFWEQINGNFHGVYLPDKRAKEDYSHQFSFEKSGNLCYPRCYKCDCGTPDGIYKLTEKTDTSYIYKEEKGNLEIRFIFQKDSTLHFFQHYFADNKARIIHNCWFKK
jgi:hypothetical protein